VESLAGEIVESLEASERENQQVQPEF
jgi:hypothetical protein